MLAWQKGVMMKSDVGVILVFFFFLFFVLFCPFLSFFLLLNNDIRWF